MYYNKLNLQIFYNKNTASLHLSTFNRTSQKHIFHTFKPLGHNTLRSCPHLLHRGFSVYFIKNFSVCLHYNTVVEFLYIY